MRSFYLVLVSVCLEVVASVMTAMKAIQTTENDNQTNYSNLGNINLSESMTSTVKGFSLEFAGP